MKPKNSKLGPVRQSPRGLELGRTRILHHVRAAVGHGLQEVGGSLALELSEQKRDKHLLEMLRVGDDLEDTSTL